METRRELSTSLTKWNPNKGRTRDFSSFPFHEQNMKLNPSQPQIGGVYQGGSFLPASRYNVNKRIAQQGSQRSDSPNKRRVERAVTTKETHTKRKVRCGYRVTKHETTNHHPGMFAERVTRLVEVIKKPYRRACPLLTHNASFHSNHSLK